MEPILNSRSCDSFVWDLSCWGGGEGGCDGEWGGKMGEDGGGEGVGRDEGVSPT